MMPQPDRPSFQKTAPDSGEIRWQDQLIAEIRALELFRFRPVPGADPLIGDTVGVPLFWRQYHGYQEPERSANHQRALRELASPDGALLLEAVATTQSGAVESRFQINVTTTPEGHLSIRVDAALHVLQAPGWVVTPNSDHGEATFLTLWPAEVFPENPHHPKRYQTCLVEAPGACRQIRHHHLNSPDKHRIRLTGGDRFAWVLEEWNPVVTIGTGTTVEAGLCAYMWDAHFGIRLCRDGREKLLTPGTRLTAAFTLSAASRAELESRVRTAPVLTTEAAMDTPVWTGGFHSFAETFACGKHDIATAWPWEKSVLEGPPQAVTFHRDTGCGFGDACSLRIHATRSAKACWLATTLGPAYGEPPFLSDGRLRLSARVRTKGLTGIAQIALRVHREGCGSVYQVRDYEIFQSAPITESDQDWQLLELTTMPLQPAPDRVHVLLLLDGCGSVWFDDVDFQRNLST